MPSYNGRPFDRPLHTARSLQVLRLQQCRAYRLDGLTDRYTGRY